MSLGDDFECEAFTWTVEQEREAFKIWKEGNCERDIGEIRIEMVTKDKEKEKEEEDIRRQTEEAEKWHNKSRAKKGAAAARQRENPPDEECKKEEAPMVKDPEIKNLNTMDSTARKALAEKVGGVKLEALAPEAWPTKPGQMGNKAHDGGTAMLDSHCFQLTYTSKKTYEVRLTKTGGMKPTDEWKVLLEYKTMPSAKQVIADTQAAIKSYKGTGSKGSSKAR